VGNKHLERWDAAAAGLGIANPALPRNMPIVREPFCSRAAVRSALWTALLTCLLGGAGQHGAQVVDVDGQLRAARAERLVGDTVAALAAYNYETVAGLHGCSLHEHEQSESSEFRVELAVTAVSAGSLKIEGVLLETRSRRAVTQFVTYRGRT
jgi:hypothetical protein